MDALSLRALSAERRVDLPEQLLCSRPNIFKIPSEYPRVEGLGFRVYLKLKDRITPHAKFSIQKE